MKTFSSDIILTQNITSTFYTLQIVNFFLDEKKKPDDISGE
jgi:hypothetical protein